MINPEAVALLRSDRSSAISWMLLLIGGLCFVPADRTESASELSVDALVALCERGDGQGGVGVDAAFCDWYLLPCDCKLGQPGQQPRWCLPEPEADPRAYSDAREHVLAVLEQLAETDQAAEAAVAKILQQHYPCAPN